MKKAVFHGIRDVVVEEVTEPLPGPRQVKVKVRYCGICGSDLHEYLHGLFAQSLFGHEACGEIMEVGPEVKGFQAGDRVITVAKDAYAEALVCSPEQLLKIPPDMQWKRAAVVEPLAGAAYALDRGGIRPEHTVFIAGAGPVGLMLLLGLKAIGVRRVFMTDVAEPRRKKAEELGASAVGDPLKVKPSA